MALEPRRARAAARLFQEQVAIGKRDDDVIGLVSMPPRLGAGTEPPLGNAHMRLRDVDEGRGFGAWGMVNSGEERFSLLTIVKIILC